MNLTGMVYRPPYEANSLLLQVTLGCSHNKCTFCYMYPDVKFTVCPMEQIEEDIEEAARVCPDAERVFLEHGDAFVLSADRLTQIAEAIHRKLPKVKTIAMYASIQNIKHKTDAELRRLCDLGVGGLDIGVESGLDAALAYMNKGHTAAEAKDAAYRENPFRAVNFAIDEDGDMVCPNGKKFHFCGKRTVKGNQYGREEEFYRCDDCTGCPYREKCCKGEGNRTVRINVELTKFHEEVLGNLNCIHGALLRMNRSIQAEGSFGGIKWNRSYTRARRRGLEGMLLEIGLISCGFNLHKFHLRRQKTRKAA